MKTWLRRVRGAIGVGLTWAIGWAIGGVLIGVSSILLPWLPWEAFFRVFDAPLPALAVPGFIGGTLFAVVLGVVERRRTVEDLSLPRVAAWGALGGLLLSLVPTALVLVGMATLREDLRLWQVTATIAGPLIVMSAASAAGSLWLARRGTSHGAPARGRPEARALTPGRGGTAQLSRTPLPESSASSAPGYTTVEPRRADP